MLKKIDDITLIQLSSSDSNIYIIGDIAIDAGTGFNFTRLKSILNVLKLDLGDIKEVVNTHGHFDHTGGNGYFLNATTAIHELDAPILEKGDPEMSVADFFEATPKPHEVQRKLNEGDIVEAGKYKFHVIHTPGHSLGSICLFDKKTGTLISGDLIFSDGIGRTDLPGSDEKAMQTSLNKIKELDVKRILPGHGDPILTDAKKILNQAAEMSNFI